jgi:hypothetical protein
MKLSMKSSGMNATLSQMDSLDITKYQLQKRIKEKGLFVSEFVSFAYILIPFGLKNAPTIFS